MLSLSDGSNRLRISVGTARPNDAVTRALEESCSVNDGGWEKVTTIVGIVYRKERTNQPRGRLAVVLWNFQHRDVKGVCEKFQRSYSTLAGGSTGIYHKTYRLQYLSAADLPFGQELFQHKSLPIHLMMFSNLSRSMSL